MKKLIIAAAFILFATVAFGQTLQKGGILGVHHLTITLNQNVTMDQFLDFLTNKWITEVEKHLDGWEGLIVKGDRGELKNKYGLVWYIASSEERERYAGDEGNISEAFNKAMEKIEAVNKELEKYGAWSSEYTDWVIQ